MQTNREEGRNVYLLLFPLLLSLSSYLPLFPRSSLESVILEVNGEFEMREDDQSHLKEGEREGGKKRRDEGRKKEEAFVRIRNEEKKKEGWG